MNRYPAIEDLERKARKRMPPVGWAYLQCGTGRERLLERNRQAFEEIKLTPRVCKGELNPALQTAILGQSFALPFGIAPVGLTGLMWPQAELILAQSAAQYQIPFNLSTVATETPERIGPLVGEMGWFQLYAPRELELCRQILERVKTAGFHTLVVTADLPIPSRRERTKRAGMQMPPRITPRFIWQGITHPSWTLGTLRNGLPRLRTIETYADMRSMLSVTSAARDKFGGNLSWEYCTTLRDEWEGRLILKGLLHPEDAEKAVEIGFDGIVVSNHGGRQFDAAPAAIEVLPAIVKAVKGNTAILFDSGVRSGLDILRCLSLGADFVLLGRPFLYGVAALGKYGGDHVIEILKDDLRNNMMQIGIKCISELGSGR